MCIISIVVAAANNGVIGIQGKLPWQLPEDLVNFRRLTMGKPVIMGRKTWDSLPGELQGRMNIVVSGSLNPAILGRESIRVRSFMDALDVARNECRRKGIDEIMVIGGAEIYAQALPMADRIYLTRVHASPEGDTHFDFNVDHWRCVNNRVDLQAVISFQKWERQA